MRRGLSWLFETPTRAIGVLALTLAALVVVFAYAFPASTGTGIGQPPIGRPSPAPAEPSNPSASATPRNSRELAAEAARRYIVAFFAPGGTTVEWHESIDAHSTATLASLNATVPRSEVPHPRLLSLRVTGITATYAEVEARMSNDMVLFVAVVLDSDEWRVNEFAPVTR